MQHRRGNTGGHFRAHNIAALRTRSAKCGVPRGGTEFSPATSRIVRHCALACTEPVRYARAASRVTRPDGRALAPTGTAALPRPKCHVTPKL
eukprot:1817105-Prymnesium_polylepis.1